MQDIYSLFFGDNVSTLGDVMAAATVLSFEPGTTILSEADTGKSVYYILAGKAKTVRYSSEGAEVWLDEIGPGALFGEMSALGASNRTATVIAGSKVTAAVFSEKSFLSLLERHGSIGLQVAKLLVSRVEKTTQRMFELAAFSSKGRVYAELLRQARPVDGSTHSVIEKMPSMSAMARLLNNTRETVSRTINELEKEGFITRTGSKLTILLPDALQDLSNS